MDAQVVRVGSTLGPEEVADEEGFSVLSWVGDHFEIPTVGIAVDTAHIPLDDPALQALVRVNRRALQTIAEQPRLAVDYVASFLDRLTSEEAQQYCERYVGPYSTSDGRVDINVARPAVDAVATELASPRQPSPRQPLIRCTCRPCDRAATPTRMTPSEIHTFA